MNHARIVERRFWTSGSINEGVDKLPKNSMFRAIAEAGVKAAAGGTTLNQSERLDRHVAVASTLRTPSDGSRAAASPSWLRLVRWPRSSVCSERCGASCKP